MLYGQLMPVPCTSFGTRYMKCQAGVMVTASHNPAKYNGYKVYGDDGCQITDEGAAAVLANIQSVDIFTGVKTMDFDEGVAKGLIQTVPKEVEEAFYQAVLSQSINGDLCKEAGLRVVYSPLNGTGNIPVRTILNRIGIDDVIVVPGAGAARRQFPHLPLPEPGNCGSPGFGPEALQRGEGRPDAGYRPRLRPGGHRRSRP